MWTQDPVLNQPKTYDRKLTQWSEWTTLFVEYPLNLKSAITYYPCKKNKKEKNYFE